MYNTDTISISTNNKTMFKNLSEQLKAYGYTLLAREKKTTEYMQLSVNDTLNKVTVYNATFNKKE